AQARKYPVMSEDLTRFEGWLELISKQARDILADRRFHKTGRLVVGLQHCFDLVLQSRVTLAGLSDKRAAVVFRPGQGGLENLCHLLPALGGHRYVFR